MTIESYCETKRNDVEKTKETSNERFEKRRRGADNFYRRRVFNRISGSNVTLLARDIVSCPCSRVVSFLSFFFSFFFFFFSCPTIRRYSATVREKPESSTRGPEINCLHGNRSTDYFVTSFAGTIITADAEKSSAPIECPHAISTPTRLIPLLYFSLLFSLFFSFYVLFSTFRVISCESQRYSIEYVRAISVLHSELILILKMKRGIWTIFYFYIMSQT